MANSLLRIATRQSPLALWQAKYIQMMLEIAYPELQIVLVPMTTAGDRYLEKSLASVGGKGLFVKELEQALLDNKADIAVHSMKDVPVEFPNNLMLTAICQREDPRDVVVALKNQTLSQLPKGAMVGTSSLRRQCQIRALYPDLQVVDLRGNVNTRIERLDRGDFDVIILAAAGLLRLGMAERITSYLSPEHCLPAIGQGALGIECRADDQKIRELVSILDHRPTHNCVLAERAVNRMLGGGCQAPVAGYAILQNDNTLFLRGLVGQADGRLLLQAFAQGQPEDAEKIGEYVAAELIAQGAKELLRKCQINHE